MIAKLTLGTEDTRDVIIDWQGQETIWKMRPLTSGELSKLQVIEKKPFHIKVAMRNGKRQAVQTNMNDIDINTAEFTEAQNEAMYWAVSLSLSCGDDNTSVEEIKGLPAGLPEALFTQVINVSSLSDDDLTMVKQFRKD